MCDVGLAGELEHDGKKIGLVLDVGGYYKNVITLAPSLEISIEEMDLAHDLLDLLIRQCREA
jgi:4-aminobutyrate aminotransferase-like enzyme